MQEISKPEKKTYYYIKNPEGTVLQEGWVNPNQVLGTPDTNTVHYSDNKLDIIPHMEADLGPQTAFNDQLTLDEETGVYSWGRGFMEFDTFFVFAMPSVAEPLSRALYSVVNPGQEGLYARVYHHPDPEQYSLMEFRSEDVIPIALGADPTPLADALAITVTDGALTQEEVDNITGAISLYAGQEINLVDFIPASWADKQTDKETAISLGYTLE